MSEYRACPTENCVRIYGHAGCHTAAPSARTLDWDIDPTPLRTKQAETLEFLDFETPASRYMRDED